MKRIIGFPALDISRMTKDIVAFAVLDCKDTESPTFPIIEESESVMMNVSLVASELMEFSEKSTKSVREGIKDYMHKSNTSYQSLKESFSKYHGGNVRLYVMDGTIIASKDTSWKLCYHDTPSGSFTITLEEFDVDNDRMLPIYIRIDVNQKEELLKDGRFYYKLLLEVIHTTEYATWLFDVMTRTMYEELTFDYKDHQFRTMGANYDADAYDICNYMKMFYQEITSLLKTNNLNPEFTIENIDVVLENRRDQSDTITKVQYGLFELVSFLSEKLFPLLYTNHTCKASIPGIFSVKAALTMTQPMIGIDLGEPAGLIVDHREDNTVVETKSTIKAPVDDGMVSEDDEDCP